MRGWHALAARCDWFAAANRAGRQSMAHPPPRSRLRAGSLSGLQAVERQRRDVPALLLSVAELPRWIGPKVHRRENRPSRRLGHCPDAGTVGGRYFTLSAEILMSCFKS